MRFCSICLDKLDTSIQRCTKHTCVKANGKVCFLDLLPIKDRLIQLYLGEEKYIFTFSSIKLLDNDNFFRYPSTRKVNSSYMTDIHDGQVFAELMKDGGVLSASGNTGLILSADGVPIFKSSQGSLWPVYLSVTSLPPEKRMLMNNIIIAALWHGPTKPPMDLILGPICNKIQSLHDTGIKIDTCTLGAVHVIRPKLVMAVFDLPARASATNTKQFNGQYGCLYCTDEGLVYQRSARIYPPDAPHKLRTTENMAHWATTADETGIAQYGVKGSCTLGRHIQLPTCVPLDYMHSILEGVFKSLLKRWFDSKFHSEPYSLRKYIHDINTILLSIKPPSEIPRAPRSIELMSYYKASEYRAWLLFYSLPILCRYLPTEYTHHLSLLVCAMHILLSDQIAKENLQVAHSMLVTFHNVAGDMYSSDVYTANMHSLLHTVPLVILWGPVWSYSMFGFESLNGYLGQIYHGTRNITAQMSFHLLLKQSLPHKLKELCKDESDSTREYLESLIQGKRKSMQSIGAGIYSIGKVYSAELTEHEENALSLIGISVSSRFIHRFDRLFLNGTIYHCNSYGRETNSCNTLCMYRATDGSIKYGALASFCRSPGLDPFCFVNCLISTGITPITKLRPPRSLDIRRQMVDSHLRQFAAISVDQQETIAAVPIHNLLKKCIRLGINRNYIIPVPNAFEVH